MTTKEKLQILSKFVILDSDEYNKRITAEDVLLYNSQIIAVAKMFVNNLEGDQKEELQNACELMQDIVPDLLAKIIEIKEGLS